MYLSGFLRARKYENKIIFNLNNTEYDGNLLRDEEEIKQEQRKNQINDKKTDKPL